MQREEKTLSEAYRGEESRKSQIVRVSIMGIAANVALAAFKAAVGAISGSIAIILDAVNNLSDAASSLITIIGTRLAGKQPDRLHPYGHGRIEYLTTIVIAALVLSAGATSLVESVRSIFEGGTPSYDTPGLVIIGVAVVAKLVMGRYVKSAGERLGSGSLVASGEDATMDAFISASTLVAALVFMMTGLSLEGWLGAVISLIIVKSGYEILRDAINKVLGERVDDELAGAVKQTISSVDGVHGAYDLFLTDYGPERLWGSVHVEVDENMDARRIYQVSRDIQMAVTARHQVLLHTVGVYPTNTAPGSDAALIKAALDEILDREDNVLEVHGLYVEPELKGANFDLVVSFAEKDREALRQRVLDELHDRFPDYAFTCVLDADISG